MTNAVLLRMRLLVNVVVYFCHERAAKECFKDWPPIRVLQYVTWHALNGTMNVTSKDGGVSGVAFAWPAKKERVASLNALGLSAFEWKNEAEPDIIFIGEVLGDRSSMVELCRFTQWKGLPFMTFRRGKLIDISAVIERLAK